MESWDIVVVGSGPAALRAAIAAADAGTIPLMIDSSGVGAASGAAPLSGLAASIDEVDSTAHRDDTVSAGGDSTDRVAAARTCGEAVSVLAELERWGLVLRRRDGGLPHASEAPGHSRARLTGCGDGTIREVTRILEEQAIKRGIPRRSDLVPLSLAMDNQQVRGIISLDLLSGAVSAIQAKAVVLATEGHQGLWSSPLNGAGTGAAIAAAAGVGLSGMAHSSMHPLTVRDTDMQLPIELLSSGGRLCKESGDDVGPEAVLEGEDCVLDLRGLESDAAPWFAETARRVRERTGLDTSVEVIPVSPSIAATTGGAPVGEEGRVTFDDGKMWFTGLYAAGRSANTGVHGAGMLPGNLLLDDLVSGQSAGSHAGNWAKDASFGGSSVVDAASSEASDRIASLSAGAGHPVGQVSASICSIMQNVNGNGDERSLASAASALDEIRGAGIKVTDASSVMNTELTTALHLEGLMLLADAIVRSEGQHERA
ncbi:FAD-binding protein [Candidatus Thalassarchaeum betae]|jgi:succinate dehydrogenase/fumarate reductase flavoprotein subunit|uniref:FAD-binding protein n=1 Tax=Candidatus Thalassarchaeum betae TaxID=2599289 RepID=UPI0030C71E5F|nr:FAD-binding protein [Candidatus Thalassoarchaea betae]